MKTYSQDFLDLCAKKQGDMVRIPTVSKSDEEELSGAGADYIVSEDAHFRVLAEIPFPNVNVIRMDEFLQDLNLL